MGKSIRKLLPIAKKEDCKGISTQEEKSTSTRAGTTKTTRELKENVIKEGLAEKEDACALIVTQNRQFKRAKMSRIL